MIGDLHHFTELVRDKDDRSAGAGVLLDEVHQEIGLLRRQHGGRFVHDQQLGVLIERLQDFDLLLYTDRQLAHDCRWLNVKSVFGCQLCHDPVVMPDVVATTDEAEDHVFSHRVGLNQGKMLLDHRNAQRHRILWGMDGLLFPVYQNLTCFSLVEAVEHLHDGAFPSPVFPQQSQHLTFVDLHGDVVVGDDLSEIFADVS